MLAYLPASKLRRNAQHACGWRSTYAGTARSVSSGLLRHSSPVGHRAHCAKGQRQSQRVQAQGFFGRVFKRPERHAPELVKLDADDEGGLGQTSPELFGPLAVLMVGFHEHEIQAFRSVMLDMEADMVKIIICDRRMFRQTLREALEAPGHMHTQRVGQRAMILSGMNAAEVGEIIGGYRDAGLPEPVWAAALAANWDRKVKDLVEDIYGDHRYMMERERKTEATS